METRRTHFMAAGALLLATAVAGTAARGKGGTPGAQVPTNGRTTFAAPGTGPVSFTGTLDRTAVLRGGDGRVRMELVMAALPDDTAQRVRRPTDVVIILDRSGSMDGGKIVHARAAIRELLGQLGPQDRFALVTYSDTATLAVPLSAVNDAARGAWNGVIAEIQASGGTNMSSGLDLGIDVIDRDRERERGRGGDAERVPHVVLISDGLANQGDPSPDGLTRRARRAAQGEYMLSTVGVGADFNEYLMTALADAGTGNYYYLRDTQNLAAVFAREFDAARSTVAAGLAVQIEPAAGVRVVDAAGYPLERAGNATVFHPGSLFAGQERRVWVTLVAPQSAVGDYDLGRFSLAYGDGGARTVLYLSDVPRVACVPSEDEYYSSVDVGAWGRSVIVDAYNKVQEEVARDVQAGRRDAALEKLRVFKDETAAMNARLPAPSAPVAQQLDDVKRLEAEVSGAFVGENQERRQNELSKAASAAALDARRAGSKK
jgi:Ca-activated chloride channel family protein